MKKLNFLYLSTTDTPLAGHAWSSYLKLPEDRFEKRIVVFQSKYKLAPSLISNWLVLKVVNQLLPIYRRLYAIIHFHVRFSLNMEDNSLYSYYQNEFLPDLSSFILRKIKGYTPDVIVVCWTPNFLTSKTIRSLHEKTGAWIHFCFIDEQHMTGGCHYPSGCVGYQNNCMDCPALSSGKIFAHYSLMNKIDNLKGLPISISSTVYDGKLASMSALFKDALILTGTAVPVVKHFEKSESRKAFNIDDKAFVIFFGCTHVYHKRKGAFYALDAVRKFCTKYENVVFLVAGNFSEEDQRLFDGTNALFTGYLGQDDMFRAYCASDVFLSTTIADSGPMMVNFSIALGIPVVAFPVGVADTLVKSGETGYLAKFQDVDDLVEGLEYIYSLSPQEKDRMREKCQMSFKDIDTTPWYDKLANHLLLNN